MHFLASGRKQSSWKHKEKKSAGILPLNHRKRFGVVLEKGFESFTPSGLSSNVEHMSFFPPGFTLSTFQSSWAKMSWNSFDLWLQLFSLGAPSPKHMSISRMIKSLWFLGNHVPYNHILVYYLGVIFILKAVRLAAIFLQGSLEGTEWLLSPSLSKSVVAWQLHHVENPYSEMENVINCPY